LLEAAVLDGLAAECGVPQAPTEHRRNLTTRGVRLEPLIGKRFRTGEVVVEGVRDCPPCEHLDQVSGKRVLRLLRDRAGIRAGVIHGGTIHVGDAIVAEELTASQ
jgi:MOSC domain-containing protein YiiM